MSAETPNIWQLSFNVSTERVPAAEALLEDQLGDALRATSRFESGEPGHWQVQAILGHQPDLEALTSALARALGAVPAVHLEPVPETDWVTASQEQNPPVRAGRYFIYGSHVKDAPPAGSIALRVDAGTAFGTGSHETTRGCLLALDRLARGRTYRNTLDIGCGTGVLAMAAAKTFRIPVLASDIDPVAVAVARTNAQINGLARHIDVVCADGVDNRALNARGPFDLVMANILAGPLVGLAPKLRTRVAGGGVAVLSGLLGSQEPMVLAAYRDQGFNLTRRLNLKGWHTLVLTRR